MDASSDSLYYPLGGVHLGIRFGTHVMLLLDFGGIWSSARIQTRRNGSTGKKIRVCNFSDATSVALTQKPNVRSLQRFGTLP